MIKYLMPALLSVMVILAGCSNDSTESETDVKELVSQLSASNTVESASIDGKNLVVQDGGEENVYNLPQDEFFVSVAPYLTYTHPCEFHSLTGCQGELIGEEMDVKITDEQGKVHIDETVTTLENGFMDFWLPRDEQYTIEVNYQNKQTEYSFSTFEEDSTCLTDLQLK
ncbi:CueP family metal-binding protein [Pontibacillus litoralis]|uniref:Uncharacterized protein n=1 Tax=Pontibacillus litoralis JSM 072002 TaxID=1385512 RepID=A0A0A5G0F8_9BACI|nr:CueP family metal-binding protein [Pontibacillus litoralis]KGX84583.1 hypothetical protein N784_13185 [Pontibacillus litoralis JSM 072002]